MSSLAYVRLDFRVRGWEHTVDEMRRDGSETTEIHDVLNEVKHRRNVVQRKIATRSTIMKSALSMLPTVSGGPGTFEKQHIEIHHGVHHDGDRNTNKRFWHRHHKTHDGQKLHAKGRADKRSKKAVQMAANGDLSPRSGSGSPRGQRGGVYETE